VVITRFISKLVVSIVLSFLCVAAVFAQEDVTEDGYRWFEIEVLVVKYPEQSEALNERFPMEIRPIPVQRARDLLTSHLRPQIHGILQALPRCSWMTDLPAGVGELRWPIQVAPFPPLPDFTTDILCKRHEERIVTDRLYPAGPEMVGMELYHETPVVIHGEGGDVFTTQLPFLLPSDALRFTELRTSLARTGQATPLLHASWRQPVFTRNISRPHRLFGGINYTKDFDYYGFAKPDDAADWVTNLDPHNEAAASELNPILRLVTAIEAGEFSFQKPEQSSQRLPTPPEIPNSGVPRDVWEFDGLLQTYLIGNYLHIDGEFNFRAPASYAQQLSSPQEQANAWLQGDVEEVQFLRGFYLNQLKRVISHEVHYFDHPKFGVIIEVRRTERSARPE